jgi:hypothetical protein
MTASELTQILKILPRQEPIALICPVEDLTGLGLETSEPNLAVVNVGAHLGDVILHEIRVFQAAGEQLTVMIVDDGQTEADLLVAYGILMDRKIGDVEIPAGFRLILAGNLKNWDPCIIDKMWVWESSTA